jgi:hypothetical protein
MVCRVATLSNELVGSKNNLAQRRHGVCDCRLAANIGGKTQSSDSGRTAKIPQAI